MKIRQGFVSNSSTTSFCIYGTDIKDLGEEKIEKISDTLCTYGANKDKNLKCSINYGWEGETIYIGRSWDNIGDDETGRQFKDQVEAEIEKLLGEKRECSYIEEAFRDD